MLGDRGVGETWAATWAERITWEISGWDMVLAVIKKKILKLAIFSYKKYDMWGLFFSRSTEQVRLVKISQDWSSKSSDLPNQSSGQF